jgi:hypothetical protein
MSTLSWTTLRRSALGIPRAPWPLLVLVVLVLAHATWLAIDTVRVRFARDVARLVFNDNLEALDRARLEAGTGVDSLRTLLSATTPAEETGPYIVVSIADRHLWYKQGGEVLFEAPVATGSGKTLAVRGSRQVVRFETPRGRLVVQRRDSAPAWIPPDWHYQEQANKRGLGLLQLSRGDVVHTRSGNDVLVSGSDVVMRRKDGTLQPYTAQDGHEIVVDGKLVIPPYGTNQRKYAGVLGTHRLYLGDGYALHGTDHPETIGKAVSHGCVRLRNEDIAALYDKVAVGTPVYIY